MEGKKVIIRNEVKVFGEKHEVLKNLITSGNLKVELKNVNSYIVKDTSMIVFISNTQKFFSVKVKIGDTWC